jgi:hypothetical protein
LEEESIRPLIPLSLDCFVAPPPTLPGMEEVPRGDTPGRPSSFRLVPKILS